MTGAFALPKQTTTIKNRLLNPDDNPRTGVPVELIVRGTSTWAADRTGRILGTIRTWTNGSGCWFAEMLPYTKYEDEQYVYVEVREGGELTGYIRVEPKPPDTSWWVRDFLIDPPDPPGPRPIIATLSSLHDVDHQSVIDAPDGAVLIKRDGMWRAEVPQLRSLSDIHESVSWAAFNDPLVFLSNTEGWGVNKPKPATINAEAQVLEEEPRRAFLQVNDFDSTKTLTVYWDDADTEPYETLPETGMYHHDYVNTSGQRTIQLYYAEDGGQGEVLRLPVTIAEG